MGKFRTILLLFIIGSLPPISAEELIDLPVYVPEVLTFFNRELQTVLSYSGSSGANKSAKFEWYYSSVFNFDMGKTDSSNLNFLGGIHIRLGSFRLPLFWATVTGIVDRNNIYNSYLGLFGGSGLIYDNRFFSLGTFAGYYNTRVFARYNAAELLNSDQKSFSFTFIPVVYTGEIPLIYLLKEIILQLNATALGINDIASNLQFGPFSLYGRPLTFSVYYRRESYASVAKNDLYGAKAGIIFSNYYNDFSVTLSLEGGYRDFFDVQYGRYLNSWYANTPFVKAEAGFIWKSRENIGGLIINVLLDRQNIPKIGVFLTYRFNGDQPLNGIAGGELGKQSGFGFKFYQELSSSG